MKYMGMPWGMWTLFAGSFQAQLTDVLGYNEQTAKAITRRAKSKYKEILSRLPEAIILPLCPDKGTCLNYDPTLAASVYLENDLEQLMRTHS